jgi:hypothetical protein
MTRINLGDQVKDKVTGFKGIAVAVTTWLNGCVRVTITPESLDKDGKIQDSQSFDEEQLELLKAGKVAAVKSREPAPIVVPKAKTGGPKPEPRRQAEPKR